MSTDFFALHRRRHAVLGVLALLVIGCSAPAGVPTAAPSSRSPSSPPVVTPAPAPPSESPAPSGSPAIGSWAAAAPMLAERVGFDAVRLGDGTVLVVGNDYACYPGPATEGSETAELYDPNTDTWVEVGSLNKPRKIPATVALRDGTAMVIGGVNADDQAFSSTKIFSPSKQTWSDGPLLSVARSQPVATMLGDGRVLVVSQVLPEDMGRSTTAELYDPATGAWLRSASPKAGYFDQLEPMADGRVLGVGSKGDQGLWLEIYDPADDAWTPISVPHDANGVSMVPLTDGSFLVLDKEDDAQRIERFDPASGRWTTAASMGTPRDGAALAVLGDGTVLAAGGTTGNQLGSEGALTTTEIYDPVADHWSRGPDLVAARTDASAIVVAGSVLLMGGTDQFNTEGDTPWCPPPMTSMERYIPGS